MLHKRSARSFTTFRIASDYGREQFGADHTTGLSIFRTKYAFVIRLARENFVCLFGSATRALLSAVVAGGDERRHCGQTRGFGYLFCLIASRRRRGDGSGGGGYCGLSGM
jgi:hypothetical protein